MVIWLIGLSGSGKTTLAEEVVAKARVAGKKVVLIDGDMIRNVFNNDLGHTLEDRKKNADRICALGKFLEEQGVNVVCAILSLFPESQEWNRNNLKNYFEVFIDTPFEKLVERDSKGLYKKALNGELKNVAGVDLAFTPPKLPDLTIKNCSARDDLLIHATMLAEKLKF